MIDLFITTFGRKELFEQSLKSLLNNTKRELFRLTIVVDGAGEHKYAPLSDVADTVIINKDNLGLGVSINSALAHIKMINEYQDNNQKNFICMVQDDVIYSPGWLEKLVKVYGLFGKKHNIGFVSGHNAPEHETTGKIQFGKDTLLLKPWIRATNMFAEKEYFLSMFPISRIDPETGRERGKPNNGMGSSCDWWFIRNHPNSICKSGRVNLVYPGLIKHEGFDRSTWLNRALPEDK